MSYSQKVKREVMAITGLSQLEMLGEVRTVITSKDGIKEDKIEIKFDNISMASRFYGLLQEITKLKIVIKYSISKNFGEHKIYNVSIPNQKGYKEFLQKLLGVTNSLILSNEHFLKGCVRGYFLYSGYVKSPEKEYAMDFFIDSSDGAQELYDLLLALDKKVFKTIKKNKNVKV